MLTGKINMAGFISMLLIFAAETGTDLGFLSDLTGKPPMNYIAFSLIGLYSSITFVCIEEKRLPNRYDFMKLIGYIPFVWGFALLVGTSPLFSLFIGIAPEPTFKFVRRKAEKWLKKQLGDTDNDDDDDGDKIIESKTKDENEKETKP
jgi:hypothetical protein